MENAKGITGLLLGLGEPSGDENQQECNSQSPLGIPGSVHLEGGQETGKGDDEMAMLPNDHRLGRNILLYSKRSDNLVAALSFWKLGSQNLFRTDRLLRSPSFAGAKNSLTFVASYLKLYMRYTLTKMT